MLIDEATVTRAEKTAFALRALYREHGYIPYRMGKFEEYDLYSRHKDFLVSDSVITFTDTNGRLLALKPDVTLSIAKNYRDGEDKAEKVYYDENVYRAVRSAGSFREIRQAGVESIGSRDAAAAGEVLLLAARSLELISEDFVLDLSHLGILSAALEKVTSSLSLQEALLKAAGEKNLHGVRSLLAESGVPEEKAAALLRLIPLCGTPDKVLPALSEIAFEIGAEKEFSFLQRALSVFSGDPAGRIRVDLSVTGDRNYYNGLIFKGFLEGLPAAVLSGGQYDNLMRRLGKKASAVGFAVYLESLEALDPAPPALDGDVLLLYGERDDPGEVTRAADALRAEGRSVRTALTVPAGLRFGKVGILEKGGIKWQNGTGF